MIDCRSGDGGSRLRGEKGTRVGHPRGIVYPPGGTPLLNSQYSLSRFAKPTSIKPASLTVNHLVPLILESDADPPHKPPTQAHDSNIPFFPECSVNG